MKQARKVLPELKSYFWQSDSKLQVAKCADGLFKISCTATKYLVLFFSEFYNISSRL